MASDDALARVKTRPGGAGSEDADRPGKPGGPGVRKPEKRQPTAGPGRRLSGRPRWSRNRVADDSGGRAHQADEAPAPAAAHRSARVIAGPRRRDVGRGQSPARDLDREPKGWGRQDHDRREPRRRAGRARLPGAGHRPRSPGQRDDRHGHQPPQRRGLDLRRDHERRADRRLHRADDGARTSSWFRPRSIWPAPRSSSCPRSPASSSCAGHSRRSRVSTTSR